LDEVIQNNLDSKKGYFKASGRRQNGRLAMQLCSLETCLSYNWAGTVASFAVAGRLETCPSPPPLRVPLHPVTLSHPALPRIPPACPLQGLDPFSDLDFTEFKKQRLMPDRDWAALQARIADAPVHQAPAGGGSGGRKLMQTYPLTWDWRALGKVGGCWQGEEARPGLRWCWAGQVTATILRKHSVCEGLLSLYISRGRRLCCLASNEHLPFSAKLSV